MTEKNLQPRILYPARLSFRFDGEVKSFLDQQMLTEFSITKTKMAKCSHLDLECKVYCALGSITMNKASGGDGNPAELFKSPKDDAVKVLHSICKKNWENIAVATGPVNVSFHSNPKERQC